MKQLLTFLFISLIASSAFAQSRSPIQEYLQNETGYAPQQQYQAPQVANPQNPYSVAQTPSYGYVQPAPAPVPQANDNQYMHSGIAGMNN